MSRLCTTDWSKPNPSREARAVENYLLDETVGETLIENTTPDEYIVIADFTCLISETESDVPETCSIAFYTNPESRYIEGDIVAHKNIRTPLPKGCHWTNIHSYGDVKHNHLECHGYDITPCTVEKIMSKLRNENVIL